MKNDRLVGTSNDLRLTRHFLKFIYLEGRKNFTTRQKPKRHASISIKCILFAQEKSFLSQSNHLFCICKIFVKRKGFLRCVKFIANRTRKVPVSIVRRAYLNNKMHIRAKWKDQSIYVAHCIHSCILSSSQTNSRTEFLGFGETLKSANGYS